LSLHFALPSTHFNIISIIFTNWACKGKSFFSGYSSFSSVISASFEIAFAVIVVPIVGQTTIS
jgi:hypothetical protein